MMDQAQIALETEMQQRLRQGAAELVHSEAPVDITRVFDLGSSGGSNIARNKDSMIAEAFQFVRRNSRRG
jgi:hypothetical protein